ncbi:MAG: hypothetical protein ACSHX6_05175 [Akkermansiaceae bacterium]
MNLKQPNKALRLSPMVPSTNLTETRNFLIKALGFEVVMDTPSYVVLTMNGYDLHLCLAGDDVGEMSIYLEVDELEVAWLTLEPELTENMRVREPFEREYGMKEFHVDIPETNTLLFVGQRV